MSKKISDTYKVAKAVAADPTKEVVQVELSKIDVGTRIRIDFPNIEELAADISEKGLTYPISVNRNYKLIDGERRLRAFRHLGRETIPAIIEDVADEDILDHEISLNVQRESFNPLEAVTAANKLMEKYRKPIGRPKKGDGSEVGVTLPQFSGNGKELEDWAAKRAGLGCGSNYTRARNILHVAIPEVQTALINKVISLNWAYQISRQKPDVQLSWLNKSVDDPDTDRKALAEMNKKRRGEKSLIRAGIDPKKTDSLNLYPDPENLYNLIRVAPDFYASKVETLAQFPIHRYGGYCSLVCIECKDSLLDKAMALQKAWGLVYKFSLIVEPEKPSVVCGITSYTPDEPIHIIVCGYNGKYNIVYEKVKTPRVHSSKTPKTAARNIIFAVFGSYAKERMLDISADKPCNGWTICKLVHGDALLG